MHDPSSQPIILSLFTLGYGWLLRSGLAPHLLLGHFQDYIGWLINALFDADAFPTCGRTASTKRAMACCRLQCELFEFYHSETRKGVKHSEVQRLDIQMWGTSEKPACRLHGGETNGMLAFCKVLCAKYGNRLTNASLWARVCDALLRMRSLCTQAGSLSATEQQD